MSADAAREASDDDDSPLVRTADAAADAVWEVRHALEMGLPPADAERVMGLVHAVGLTARGHERACAAALAAPVPADGAFPKPHAAEINALPDPLRDYIHDLECRYDPAGDVRTIHCLREQLAASALQPAGAGEDFVRQLAEFWDGMREGDGRVSMGELCDIAAAAWKHRRDALAAAPRAGATTPGGAEP